MISKVKVPKRLLFFLLLTIFVACSLIGTISYVHYRTGKQKYNDFLLAEHKTIFMFDVLNEDVVENLPELPAGSTIEEQQSVGIDAPLYEHGRWLRMKITTTQTKEDVLEYYGSYLLDNGWQKNTDLKAFETVFYYRGASCIQIDPPINQNRYYRILIWHDFRNQAFSPQMPDKKTMSWFEYGMTNIAVCP
jgi:hypothetical protein